MATIEERAQAYLQSRYDGGDYWFDVAEYLVDGYEQGAEEEHELLTRWRNPKKELPENDDDVLIKTPLPHKYQVAFYKASAPRNYHWHENNGAIDDDMIIGWRPILE